jgi:HTH-type transcriptional regulator, sugar sensing transcriptional regulator
VSLSSARETFAMVIESQEYAEMQRNFFEVLWSVSADAAIEGSKSAGRK